MAFFQDQFNRANENPIASPWTNFVGALRILSNVVRGTSVDSPDIAGSGFTTAANDFSVQVQLITESGTGENYAQLYMADGSGNGYNCLVRTNPGANPTSEIRRIDGFGETALVTESATTWAANDIVKFIRRGSSMYLLRLTGGASTQLLTTTDATYSVAAGATLVMQSNTPNTNANQEVDNFEVHDLTKNTRAFPLGMEIGTGWRMPI